MHITLVKSKIKKQWDPLGLKSEAPTKNSINLSRGNYLYGI